MTKRLALLTILSTILCTLSTVDSHAMGGPVPSQDQDETFTPGTYKVYKNDELGFSFKYPENWYLNVVDKGALLCELASYNPENGTEGMSQDEVIEVNVLKYQEFEKISDESEVKNRLIRLLKNDNQLFIIDSSNEIKIKGGMVYLIKAKRKLFGKVENIVRDYAYLYVIRRNKPYDSWIELNPFRLPVEYEGIYYKLLKSIEIE